MSTLLLYSGVKAGSSGGLPTASTGGCTLHPKQIICCVGMPISQQLASLCLKVTLCIDTVSALVTLTLISQVSSRRLLTTLQHIGLNSNAAL